jgi:pyruvate dehydrogenase E1 component
VDRHHIVVSALKALADEDKISLDRVAKAIDTFGIDPDFPHPLTC